MERQGDRFYDKDTGKYYRIRRGKLVEIPIEWVNRVTTPATIRRRDSKLARKFRLGRKRNNVVRYDPSVSNDLDLY